MSVGFSLRSPKRKMIATKQVYHKNKSPVKEQVLEMVKSLPEDVTLDDILAEIYFKSQVDAGLKELDEGRGLPHEEVEKRMSKWITV